MSNKRYCRRVEAYRHEGIAAVSAWTHADVIDAFREFERTHGEMPKARHLGHYGLPWMRVVTRLFGSLPAAHTAAAQPPLTNSEGRAA